MENLEPSLQQPPGATVAKTTSKILATLMKFFLVFLLLGFALVGLASQGGLILLWVFATYALPVFGIYVIYIITSKALFITGVLDKPAERGEYQFFGKSKKKTLTLACIIILVAVLGMYLILHNA